MHPGPPSRDILASINSDFLDSERAIRRVLREVPLDVLGQRIRAHRTACGLTIRQLAERAMLSKTSVVSLEHGQSCHPTTLAKVCAAMNLHLERLIDPFDARTPAATRVHRIEDYRWFDMQGLESQALAEHALTLEEREALRSRGPDALMTMFRNLPVESGALIGLLELTQPTELRCHPGSEFVYVLSGTARVTVEGEVYDLRPGESIFIEAMREHGYATPEGAKDPISLLILRLG